MWSKFWIYWYNCIYLVIKIDVKNTEVFVFDYKYEIQLTNLHTEYFVNLQIIHA